MITRISKIARLPKDIREQLNRRLENGDIGRTILPWLNELPETKKILADLFAGNAVTHQNLSEWRRGGYQDWLLHQQRLEWFDRLSENEIEINQHDQCGDAYETTANFFLFEIGQAVASLPRIKNPDERCARLQNLNREFARLQNSYNWSRRVQLDWDKWNDQFETDDGPQPEPPTQNPGADDYDDDDDNSSNDHAAAEQTDTTPESSENIPHLDEPENPVPHELEHEPEPELPPDAKTQPGPFPENPPSHPPYETHPREHLDAFQPIPARSPATPPFIHPANHHPVAPRPKPHLSPTPIRGRRWECIEG
jgi:hypothetical protein